MIEVERLQKVYENVDTGVLHFVYWILFRLARS